ncbi:MAG: flagellar hook capping protein [Candidatus Hydrogenedentes bacterium]|nr:flagellar hook capping protein [Candidatus Hydrogenedentota bacterium]
MSINRTQRQQAQEEIISTFKAKVLGASGTQKSAAAKASDNTATDTLDNELDKDAFLRLLVTQLQNQDPLEPVDNTDMIAQLAQFSALEQQNNLNESFQGLSTQFEALTGNVDQLNFISAQGLLDKYIEGVDIDGKVVAGKVESVHLDGSIVVLSVNDTLVPMSGVIAVADSAPAGTAKSNNEENAS